jgi:hypothetical protein
MSRAFLFGPSCYLLLLLALGVGLITLLACTLGMLLSALRMLHALCVIALAVLISGGAVRLCSIFVEFGGFVVIAIRHVKFLKSSSQRGTICQTPSRSRMSRNGVAGMRVFHLEPRTSTNHFEFMGFMSWSNPPYGLRLLLAKSEMAVGWVYHRARIRATR